MTKKITTSFFSLFTLLILNTAFANEPVLELQGSPVVANQSISFVVKYIAVGNAEIDFERSSFLLNGKPIAYQYNPNDKTFTIDQKNLSNGKQTFLFKVYDQQGLKANNMFLPFWLEDQKFNWEDAILYQVMTDRFANGDLNNDAPTPNTPFASNWQGGDFRGLIDKIKNGYFDQLAINALWISSPIINTDKNGLGTSDPHYFSAYHSYWPIGTGWTDETPLPGLDSPIDPHFGTSDELHELVQLAHQHGIRIVVDFVANHIHNDSPLTGKWNWFNNLYVCGWDQPITCWFTDYLPDFNYKNPEVMKTVIDHAIWMVQEYDIDGFRLDAVKHMDMSFTTTMRQRIQKDIVTTGIPFYMVGETFTGDSEFGTIGAYIDEDKLDGQFDFPLFYHVSRTFLLESESFRDFNQFLYWNDRRYQNEFFKKAIMSNFFGNHDIARAISVANYDFYPDLDPQGGSKSHDRAWYNQPSVPAYAEPYKKLMMAQTFLMTSTGIPLVYQGDEFGMPGAHDPDNRRMMIFGEELNSFQQETLTHFSKLGAIRSQHPALRYGERRELWVNDKFYVYSMQYQNDLVIVAFNKHPDSFSADVNIQRTGVISGLLEDQLNGETTSIENGQISITLPARTAAVYTVTGNCPTISKGFFFDPAQNESLLNGMKAETVKVVGTFNNWDLHKAWILNKNSDGTFSSNIQMPKGMHYYKFVINDARWIPDLGSDPEYNKDDGIGWYNSGMLLETSCR